MSPLNIRGFFSVPISAFLIASILGNYGVLSSNEISLSQTHKDITVKVGEDALLTCTAPEGYMVRACTFTNADTKETFQIFTGASYEDGRIVEKKDSNRECSMEITNVLENDNGQWTCSVAATDENNESSQGEGIINLTVAVPPKEIKMYVDDVEIFNDRLEMRLEEGQIQLKKIKCEAVGARPEPKFKWSLGDSDNVEGDVESSNENNNFAQTLLYRPVITHNGKMLICSLDHYGYSAAQINNKENEKGIKIQLLFKPKEHPKVQEIYISEIGKTEDVRINFEASPKPSSFSWNIAGLESPVSSGGSAMDGKYVASEELIDGDISGSYIAVLQINNVAEEDVDKIQELKVTNAEGETNYQFKLVLGDQPPAESMNSGPVIGVIIVVVIILILIGVALVARSKGLLCFAGSENSKNEDTEAAVEKEGSDTESAEHAEDDKEKDLKKKNNGVKSFLLAAVKKSVSTKKEKYSTEESELKLKGEEKKDAGKEDVTYADLDKTAMSAGNRPSLTEEDEKTEYAEIQHQKKEEK